MKRIVNVLWTGGLDSTCRIAELSRNDVIVQPYYIVDPLRGSFKKEINAMKKITGIIRADKNTVCELRDVKCVELASIAKDNEITEAWKTLHERYQLGFQYDWLARFAKQNNLILEIGLEKGPRGHATNTVNSESKLIPNDENDFSELKMDINNSSHESILIFGQLRFCNTIWNMTKAEEVEEIKDLGLNKILNKIWFCHFPIWGLTCGHCNPCKDAMRVGSAYRVSRLGSFLWEARDFYRKIKGRLWLH